MNVQQLSTENLIGLLNKMLLIRNFELTVGDIFATGRLPGFIHLSVGEEAVPVGVCANLRDDDYITSTHRGHGHCIAKGVEVNAMMAELFGKETGTSKGKGGSMHIFDFSIGMLGANGIVGAGAPLAIGAGLSAKYRKTDQVTVCFFGDAAANQGALHESMNIAGLWKLPVVFVCENNQFGQFTRHELDSSVTDVSMRARGYNMPGEVVDGMDVLAVYERVGEAVRNARAGKGPTLIEAKTYRFRGHFEGDQQVYRTQTEVDEWRKKDPILRLKGMMIERGLLSEAEFTNMENGAKTQISNAVKFAEDSPAPAPSEYLEDVYVSYG
ncbi:MAG: thiamine pyrophosphate-dependent dehydrogenase E1 component subunit alpha [Thaumarchaeota archaeon]|nr:thiamine pyrophosphate-dependent dehydrogenase E1 component subunit alpha [Nitrososphaerota archaeon]